jgi:cytidine deaminase
VHGEQCALANAFMHGEGGLTSLAVTAAPCGHCRQFLNELPDSADLKILVKDKAPTTLAALLPASFGPDDLKVAERLFKGKKTELHLTMPSSDELCGVALDAASRAYAPYTQALSGVALASSSGALYPGSYIESAAYNPSLSPLQSALAGLILASERPSHITSVVLVELENAPISQWNATQAVMGSLAPEARVRRLTARLKP